MVCYNEDSFVSHPSQQDVMSTEETLNEEETKSSESKSELSCARISNAAEMALWQGRKLMTGGVPRRQQRDSGTVGGRSQHFGFVPMRTNL